MWLRLAVLLGIFAAFLLGRESAAWHIGPGIATDGDTVKIGSERFRLKGVRAPEEKTSAGEEATSFLRTTLIAGRWIACRDTGHATFDRHEAFCFNAHAADIGAAVIAAGLACAATQARYRVDRYLRLQPAHRPADCGN